MDLTTATLQELRIYKEQVTPNSDEYNMVSNRIAELEMTEQAEAKEMEVVSVEVAKFMDSLDFEGAEPKELFLNYGPEGAEASYNYVNTVIQNAVVAMKKTDLQRIKELETSNDAIQDKLAQYAEENEKLGAEVFNTKLESSDLASKLSNATRMLEEERQETESLKQVIEGLRQEIEEARAAVPPVAEIDVRSAREKWLEQKDKEEASKPVIYNIRWEDDFKKTHYLAELAETDETIKFPYISMNGDITKPTTMKGKYRVVTSEDATTFRNAYLEANQVTVGESGSGTVETEGQVVVPSVPTPFQDDSESTTDGLAEGSLQVVGQVGREEFEDLISEVEYLKAAFIKNGLNL